jgi:phosphatidylglycerophosphate synthase
MSNSVGFKKVRHTRELGPVRTLPNVITVIRTVVAIGLGIHALTADDRLWWTVAGYAVYYLGDSLDGLVARLTNTETRLGGVHDIISDRACTAVLAANLILMEPHLWPAVLVFLLNFMVLDCVLSLSFLLWDIVSPNYFFVVDAQVFAWNWSHPAKAINNAGVIVAVLSGSLPVAMVIVLAQIAVKLASAKVVLRRARELYASPADDE